MDFNWWKDKNESFYNQADPNTQGNIQSFLSGQLPDSPTDSFNQWRTANTDYWNNTSAGNRNQIGGYLENLGYSRPQDPPSQSAVSGVDFSGLGPSYNWSQSRSSNVSSGRSGLNQMGNDALAPLLGTGPGSMPDLLDQWGQQAMDQYRVDSRDIVNTLNQVANQRAIRGIMGGTEAENLRANMLTNLARPTLENRANVSRQLLGLKSNAIPTLLGLTRESTSSGRGGSTSQSYGQSPDDYRIIASILNQSY